MCAFNYDERLLEIGRSIDGISLIMVPVSIVTRVISIISVWYSHNETYD